MTESPTSREQLIQAALKLAAERPWADVTLLDIAEAAGLSLADVRKLAGAKSQIVAQFMRTIDDQVLARAKARTQGQPTRDTLFEVVMSRFDALQPHKAAVRSFYQSGTTDTSLVMPYLNSQRWMLAAAGVDVDGPAGLIRTTGFGTLYMSVFRVWLDDEDPGMARTMAALDSRLRRGERTLSAFEDTVGGVARVARDLPGVLRSVFTRRASPVEPTPPPSSG
jgi:AcrR family transcriptional regulator